MPEFTHPQQVRDLLAATIGEDVFNEVERQAPMHNVGNPLPIPPKPDDPAQAPAAPQPLGPVPAQPAPGQQPQQADPAQARPPAAPTADSTEPPDGQPAGAGRLLGKYERTAEGERLAEDSYHKLLHANKELLRQNELLRGQGTPLTPPIMPETRTDPVQRSSEREELLKRLADKYEVDPADFAALARIEAMDAVQSVLAPRDEYAKADQFMAERYPNSMTFRDELVQFVQADPELSEAVGRAWTRGDYKGAMELAWLKYDFTQRGAREHQIEVNVQARQEEVLAARKDAGLITSQVSGVHETSPAQFGPSQEEANRLESLWRAGYKEPWLREMIGKTLPDELFGVER